MPTDFSTLLLDKASTNYFFKFEYAPFIPDAQTLFTVVQTTELGIPAPSAACLAGAWPKFALRTLPKNTSCTNDGSTFALLRAAASRHKTLIIYLQK